MTTPLKERLRELRLQKESLKKRVMPLVAYYGRDPDFEARRNEFYAQMGKLHKWNRAPRQGPEAPAGRDGRPAQFRVVSRQNVYPVIENTAPLEYLFSKGLLSAKRDETGASARRYSAGQKLRGLIEDAQISGMKTPDLEGASGGGAPGRLPGEYKMDCIIWLSILRGPEADGGLPTAVVKLLEDVVYFDRWVWEKAKAERRGVVLMRICMALDLLSVRFRMITQEDFNARWRVGRRPAEEKGSSGPSPDRPSHQGEPLSPPAEPPHE